MSKGATSVTGDRNICLRCCSTVSSRAGNSVVMLQSRAEFVKSQMPITWHREHLGPTRHLVQHRCIEPESRTRRISGGDHPRRWSSD